VIDVKKPARKANAEVGYGPNNPEPIALKESEFPKEKDDALHVALEYINGRNSATDNK
jgi:hypothetical protein